MFPAAFDYRAPASLQEALSILKERGDDAKVMAGGQSLIPLLKLRFARPELVVDIGRLPSMNNVMRRGGHTAIGALVRHVDVENSKELASSAPMRRGGSPTPWSETGARSPGRCAMRTRPGIGVR